MSHLTKANERERISIVVRGQVQGVGFRPFVSALARRLSLGGVVRNDVHGVNLEIEGGPDDVTRFVEALREDPPPLARIEEVHLTPVPPIGEASFRIESSHEQSTDDVADDAAPVAFITPDTATCEACTRELFDETNRRYLHPFINCTDCGPRLTILDRLPYDREHTTMASFAMCALCREEYEESKNRRFHAQPIACRSCGPRLELLRPNGAPVAITDDGVGPKEITVVAKAIREGAIVAVKGVGGYHLACNARDEHAVARLRRSKDRDAKPFALMVASLEDAEALCEVSSEEAELLCGHARPIVLLARRASAVEEIAPAVAPDQHRLGVMLPYTPLHLLLVRACGVPLVMTSGNVRDEPIAFADDDAVARLGPLVDWILRHDRPIRTRVEDSIAQVVDDAPALLRRSRGYVPAPLELPLPLAKPTIALGGHLKAAFALGVGQRAFTSPHFGDLDHVEALRSFRAMLEHYESLLHIAPACVVHDLHPDYATTQIAAELETQLGLERIAIQHHEAHVASVFAENIDPDRRAIGVAFDGAGWGRDGTVWGGELFVGSLASGLERRARLRPVALPGGDAAAREPWRMAVSHLLDAEIEPTIDRVALSTTNITERDIEDVARLAENAALTPRTSSVGRLFDAVAALIGVRTRSHYEAQAAMELQAIAAKRRWTESASDRDEGYPFEVHTRRTGLLEIDPRLVIEGIVDDVTNAQRDEDAISMCYGFHVTIAKMIVSTCEELRAADPTLEHVGLSGGVFANDLLVELTLSCLRSSGFLPFVQRDVPTNDGGLAFGQLALAAARAI